MRKRGLRIGVAEHGSKAALFDGFDQVAKALSTGRRVELIDEFDSKLAEFPDDVEIVAYCRGPLSVCTREKAIRRITAIGRRASRLEDGYRNGATPACPSRSDER